jgi:hypothetical protein
VLLDPEFEGVTVLTNVSKYSPNDTASHFKTPGFFINDVLDVRQDQALSSVSEVFVCAGTPCKRTHLV